MSDVAAVLRRAVRWIDVRDDEDLATWDLEAVQPVIDALRQQGWTVTPPPDQPVIPADNGATP